MKAKKFKTVSGYLRSHQGLDISTRGMSEEQIFAEHRAKQRRTINHLLPQLGLPILEDTHEKPSDGIKRLIEAGGTETQVKALKDCLRWLKRYIIITSSRAVPQVKTADGLVSYHVYGFRRGAPNSGTLQMIVDAEEYGGPRASEIAEGIAGPEYMFHASQNILHPVPDSAKNKLFFSDEELYAAAPELAPKQKPKRRGIASYQSGGVASVTTPAEPPAEPVRRKKVPLTPADWRR